MHANSLTIEYEFQLVKDCHNSLIVRNVVNNITEQTALTRWPLKLSSTHDVDVKMINRLATVSTIVDHYKNRQIDTRPGAMLIEHEYTSPSL